jgi:hypothetical protein
MIASLGSVEIRKISAGCIAQTCVKGEQSQARETALRRLAKYTHGDNLSGTILGTVRPVTQQQQASGRWLIAIRLTEAGNVLAAPTPCAPKVQIGVA